VEMDFEACTNGFTFVRVDSGDSEFPKLNRRAFWFRVSNLGTTVSGERP
jgi:hypothetical protein